MFSSVNQPLPSSAELPCSDDIPVDKEILTWYGAQGNRHLSAEEQERRRTKRLEAYLRSQGINPDQLPE